MIQHGRATAGGGLFNSGGHVTLSAASFLNNVAQGSAGRTGVRGVPNALPGTGGAVGAGGGGGSAFGSAIFNAAGAMNISGSSFDIERGDRWRRRSRGIGRAR
jgi:hypothetical protein